MSIYDGNNLYNERIDASRKYREEQWRQFEEYLHTLEDAAASRDVYPADFSSENAYVKSIAPLRKLLAGRMGFPPLDFDSDGQTVPRIELAGEDELATYYRCWIPCAASMTVYGLYMVPKGLKTPAPFLIAQHGGGGTPEKATFNGGANYHDMTRGALQRGYIVFAPGLMFNVPEDVEEGCRIRENIRPMLDARLKLLGTSLAAVEVGKIATAIDVLSRRDEIDACRIGMIGLSYGGFYTLYATALIPEIQCAVSSCFFNDEAVRMPYAQPTVWQDMRFQGTLSELADPELVALCCPRPVQIQVGIDDPMFPVASAREMSVRAAAYYSNLNISERYEFHDFAGNHEFCDEVCWPFLERWLQQ